MRDLYAWLEYYDDEVVHIGYPFATKEPRKGRMVLMCSMHIDEIRDTFGMDLDKVHLTDRPTRIEMSMEFLTVEEDEGI